MRRILVVIALLCGTASAATFVRCSSGTFLSNTMQLNIVPAAGNTLILAVGQWQDRTAFWVRASDGVDLARDTRVNFGTLDTGQLSVYRYSNLPAGVTSVSALFNTSDYIIAMVCEISGLTATPLDVADATGGGTGNTTWQTGSITTTNPTDFVLSVAATEYGQSPMLAAAPFQIGAHAEYPEYAMTLAYRWVSETGTFQASGTGGGTKNMAVIIAYRTTEAPPADPQPTAAIRHRVVSQ